MLSAKTMPGRTPWTKATSRTLAISATPNKARPRAAPGRIAALPNPLRTAAVTTGSGSHPRPTDGSRADARRHRATGRRRRPQQGDPRERGQEDVHPHDLGGYLER